MPNDDMWQRFSNPATRVIHFAQEEAKRLGVNLVGTEYLLSGLLREGEGVAARVLQQFGLTLASLRQEMTQRGWGKEGNASSSRLTLSPAAKKALECALQQARAINTHLGLPDLIDTEHLMLGLLEAGREEEHRAMVLLAVEHVDPAAIREKVLRYLGMPVEKAASPVEDRAEHRIPTDVWLNFSEAAFRVMRLAIEEAHRQETEVVGLAHLALGLFRFDEEALAEQGVSIEQVRQALAGAPAAMGAATVSLNPQLADAFGFAFQAAMRHATAGELVCIIPVDMLQGLIEAAKAFDASLLERIAGLGVDLEKFAGEL